MPGCPANGCAMLAIMFEVKKTLLNRLLSHKNVCIQLFWWLEYCAQNHLLTPGCIDRQTLRFLIEALQDDVSAMQLPVWISADS